MKSIALPAVLIIVALAVAVVEFPPAVALFIQALASYAFAVFVAFIANNFGWDLNQYVPAAVAFVTQIALAFLSNLVGQFPPDIQPLIVQALVLLISLLSGYAALKSYRMVQAYRKVAKVKLVPFWHR